MNYGTASDDVAESFREALLDLNMNSRYEISNLTVIAKENTEHALAISEALKSHIKQVGQVSLVNHTRMSSKLLFITWLNSIMSCLIPLLTICQTSPAKKLLAFYVLDSIVKNVGTPYTLFFGRQLYTTFMEAYALVDNNVRRKMDEMLKTWKEPVPGSIDTRPVFPPEVTRPIENALIKARTSAVQAQQEHQRNQQQLLNRGRPTASPVPYRATPPPNSQQVLHPPTGYTSNYSGQQYPAQQYSPVNGQQYASTSNGPQPYGLPPVRYPLITNRLLLNEIQRPPGQQYPPLAAPAPSWQPQNQVYGAPEDSVDTLSSDVANLITIAKGEFARNPLDSSKQLKLKALLDLQNILQKQKLPPDQLSLIKEQVAELSKPSPTLPNIQTPSAPPPAPAPAPVPLSLPAAQPPAQQPTLRSLLGSGALAALLARQSATPQPTPPSQPADPIRLPQQFRPQPPYQPPPPATPTSTPAPDPNSLLERLRAAGMLPAVSAASSTPTIPQTSLTGNLPPGFPPLPSFMNTPPSAARTPLASIPNDVVLKPASLKM
jgi:pre-mRNA cleavage complex 2 protein Pcf11